MKTCFRSFGILLLLIGSAFGQDYPSPNRPIRVVVPWPAGGNTDAVSRVLVQQLSRVFSTPVFVENRPGANGQIGAQSVARAAADGYTLLVASAETHSMSQALNPALSYDPQADFIPILPFAKNPFVLAGRKALPMESTRSLVDFAKANPGKLTFGSWGAGSTGQIAMEMFKREAGIDLLHVPFQGTAPAEIALLGGQIDLLVIPAGRAAVLRAGGTIKLFGAFVGTRLAPLGDVPSLKEDGFANIEFANWFGIMAPAGTPDAVVQKLTEMIGAVVSSPRTKTELEARGVEVLSMSNAQFRQFVADEQARWSEAVSNANIRAQAK